MSNPQYIIFTADVTKEDCDQLVHAAVKSMEASKQIYVVVQTMGGGNAYGLFAYYMLRALPLAVTTVNLGVVGSAGNYIYLAGDNRLCVSGAVFGFHGSAGLTDQANVHMRDVFLYRTKLDCTVGNTLVRGETDPAVMRGSDWALENGFVHEIVSSFDIPEGSGIITIWERIGNV